MKRVIVCVDDDYGRLFNKRRQSQDQLLRENILSFLNEKERLFMNAYTYKQFKKENEPFIVVTEDFMESAGESDWCFVENTVMDSDISDINEILLYKWNRKYPSDLKLELSLADMTLTETIEFVGKSHEKITRERYIMNHTKE